MTPIVTAGFVDGFVNQFSLGLVPLFDRLQAAQSLGPFQYQADYINRPAGWGVEQRILFSQRLVIEQVGQIGWNLGEQVFPNDTDDHASRAGILLGAGVDHGIF